MRVFACLASSLNGFISPAKVASFQRITSSADMRHLESVRDQANVTIFGAETFRTYPKEHTGTLNDHALNHIIMSLGVELDWKAPLFHSNAPVTIASPLPRQNWPGSVPDSVGDIQLPSNQAEAIAVVLEYCTDCGFENILIEGGGVILEQFFATSAIDELYLTLAPRIIADPSAPALIPGRANWLADVCLELLDSRDESGDVFLHYRVLQEREIAQPSD